MQLHQIEWLAALRDIAILLLAALNLVLIAILCLIAFLIWRLFVMIKNQVPGYLDIARTTAETVRDATGTVKETATTVKGTTAFLGETVAKPAIRVTATFAAARRFLAVFVRGGPAS
jgi:uncharacterized membrane protein